MTRAAAIVLVLALALISCAATLQVRGTTPQWLAEGTCERYLESPATSPMWVYASAAGMTDSLWKNPGDPFEFRWQLPSGRYWITAWARNGGGASCSTWIELETISRPAPVRLSP